MTGAAIPSTQFMGYRDLGEVSDEIEGIVSRRRAVITFYSSMYAAMSVYFDKLIFGPPSSRLFLGIPTLAVYLFVMAVLGAICAIRLARLHYGMVLHGVYHAVMRTQSLDPAVYEGPITLRKTGVSTLHVVLTSCMAGVTFGCLVGYLSDSLWLACCAAVAVIYFLWRYFRRCCHEAAANKAIDDIKYWEGRIPPVTELEKRKHEIKTLDMCQHDMLAIVTSMGLLVFGLFQTLAELEKLKHPSLDVPVANVAAREDRGTFDEGDGAGANGIGVTTHVISSTQLLSGALLAASGIFVSCVISIIAYARLSRAVTESTDRLTVTNASHPTPWISDSLLGFALLVVIALLAWHTFLFTVVNYSEGAIPVPGRKLQIFFYVVIAIFSLGWYHYQTSVASKQSK